MLLLFSGPAAPPLPGRYRFAYCIADALAPSAFSDEFDIVGPEVKVRPVYVSSKLPSLTAQASSPVYAIQLRLLLSFPALFLHSSLVAVFDAAAVHGWAGNLLERVRACRVR